MGNKTAGEIIFRSAENLVHREKNNPTYAQRVTSPTRYCYSRIRYSDQWKLLCEYGSLFQGSSTECHKFLIKIKKRSKKQGKKKPQT